MLATQALLNLKEVNYPLGGDMLAKTIAIITGVSTVAVLVLFLTTTPATAGPLGILIFFIFLYLSALGVLTFLFHGVSLLLSKVVPKGQTKFRAREITLRKSYYYSSVVASVPVMYIAIQSVGNVGLYQILLILFFAATAWVYISNRLS